ncbi:hypothetical protein ACTMTF_38305 [Nonomuraea sp. ZG12]|uniref:hypothetical protein n=1 Tax=Nonomuraea sp. ZG12 TaxID=3452207 RepID=UPI003F89ACFE
MARKPSSRTAQTCKGMPQAAREVFGEHGFAEASVAGRPRAGRPPSVARAQQSGVEDPVESLIAGARTWLDGAWERRDLVRLVIDGDGPPGFELIRRARGRAWVRRNAVLIVSGGDPLDRFTVTVLTLIRRLDPLTVRE